MAFHYLFEDYQHKYPRDLEDPGGLNVERTATNLLALRAMLDDPESPNFIPPKSSHEHMLIATWNIQALGGSERYDESYWYITEILSRFDVIAVQEVKRDLSDLDRLCDLLGPWWRYLVSDVTVGTPGNHERLAYLYDIRKLRHSGLAGELVLPDIEDADGNLRPARQIARTPFVAGFKTAWFHFMVATVHIYWGEEEADQPVRVQEIRQLAQFLDDRRGRTGTWSRNVILLGDFNMFEPDGQAAQALQEFGFIVPHGREDLRATNVGQAARFYDQIAFSFDETAAPRIGVVDFFDAVYTDAQLPVYQDDLRLASGARPANPDTYYRHHWRRRQMSDHLVLWAELPVDFSADYLTANSQ